MELARLEGVNHLLLAATGAAGESASLENREITPRIAEVLIDWIRRTVPAE